MFEKGEIPSLNGWRAVSVVMVLIAHSGWVIDSASFRYYLGAMGVRFFFVISGFLITWLLLREIAESGRVNLKAFYVRRAFRILPVYYVFLAVCYTLRGAYPGGLSPAEWFANLLFLTNYTDAKWITGHLWTLAVEEQFYVIWPLVFILCRGRAKSLRLVLCGVIATCPVVRGLAYLVGSESSMVFHRFSFSMQADVLAAGCLAAVMLWDRPLWWELVRARKTPCLVVGMVLISLLWVLPEIQGFNLIQVPLGPTMQAVGFILLLLPSMLGTTGLMFQVLNFRPLVWVGILSYSTYIWHVLFVPSGWLGRGGAITGMLFSNPVWMLIALATATASYYLLERPLLGLRRRFLTHH
jgi:peptidoglycan/LPS O-acetylase OafA/YrhL